jgi:excisionase family DNA binding protein
VNLSGNGTIAKASKAAIARAKSRAADQVSADDLLVGSLQSISRFGISLIGPWTIDLELMGESLPPADTGKERKVAYAPDTVSVFDKAAVIAKQDKSKVELVHLLVAFAYVECQFMEKLKRTYSFTSTEWRAELAKWRSEDDAGAAVETTTPAFADRSLLNPEEAAGLLGVHTQTVRGYIRSGKLPAHRLAGERALRIRREDVFGLLEPFSSEEMETNHNKKGA